MYVGYFIDRQELRFKCLKDIHAVKQLSNFKNTFKNRVTCIKRRGKETVVLIFSKEVLVAVFIFVQSIQVNIDLDLYHPAFSSSEVYQSYVSKSDNLGFLTAFSQIPDFILKLKGGSDELTNEEQERLVKSILAKAPESNFIEISINKFLKKILKLIDPVISNEKLWRILNELEKPLKPQLSNGNPISSTDILAIAQNVQNKQSKSKGSSSIFAEAFTISNSRKLSPM